MSPSKVVAGLDSSLRRRCAAGQGPCAAVTGTFDPAATAGTLCGVANLPEPVEPARPGQPAEPVDPRQLRVSNADRERVATALQRASADGRLELDELDQRLAAAYAAKTFADLEPLTRDLPAPAGPEGSGHELQPTSRWGLAMFGGFSRKGAWVVPRRFRAVVFCGGGQIDLRHARFTAAETRITIFALMGGVEVVVPPEAHVVANGVAVMGGWDQPADAASTPGGPQVTVNGLAIMGGVGVQRRRRKKG
jgi:hypothetical protein